MTLTKLASALLIFITAIVFAFLFWLGMLFWEIAND